MRPCSESKYHTCALDLSYKLGPYLIASELDAGLICAISVAANEDRVRDRLGRVSEASVVPALRFRTCAAAARARGHMGVNKVSAGCHPVLS